MQKRHPQLVLPVLRAAEAFDRAESSGQLSPQDLRLVAEMARVSPTTVSEYASGLLGRLACRFEAAREEILDMARGAKVHVRVNALVALESMEPGDMHVSVGRIALRDRSTRVKELAASKISSWRISELLPALEEAIAAESDAALRKILECERDLLRDGYRIERHGSKVEVTCRTKTGGVILTAVSEEEFQSKGIAGVARKMGVDLPLRLKTRE